MSNKIIFTDFFDTVMFRRIHSSQIYVQWAKALIHKYPVIGDNQTPSTLELLLHECREKLRMQYKEPPYQLVIGLLYDKLIETTQLAVNKEQFIIQSLKIDIAVELGCQYPNEHLVKRFRKAKMDGMKIYIVSDFYLPQEAYNAFLMKSHLDDLFDGVYVSETFNCTKSDGSLYVYVLNDLHLDPEYVEMYGDNRHSDVKMAKINGIKGKWYFPLKHKVWTNISRKLNWDYSKRIVRKESWWLYRHTNFEEYSLVLYYFNQKLTTRVNDLKIDKVAFLSRGGYFLLKIFNALQVLITPLDRKSRGEYCYNSRKVCFTARDQKAIDGEQYKLMHEYMNSFKASNGNIYIIDEGWYNHSQQAMCSTFGYNIYGFYIGSRAKEIWKEYNICHREGLLFDYRTKYDKSKYYGIFCTNCSMYEQMLTAEHGSVIGYGRNDKNEIIPILKVSKKEDEIYHRYIKHMQECMLLQIEGIAVWLLESPIPEKQLAKIVLRASVFANHRRCRFLNDLDKHRFDNCSSGKRIPDKSIKDVKINIAVLLLHPADYLGMFCKLQRKLDGNIILRWLYYPIAICYYIYIYILTFVK